MRLRFNFDAGRCLDCSYKVYMTGLVCERGLCVMETLVFPPILKCLKLFLVLVVGVQDLIIKQVVILHWRVE